MMAGPGLRDRLVALKEFAGNRLQLIMDACHAGDRSFDAAGNEP